MAELEFPNNQQVLPNPTEAVSPSTDTMDVARI
jgi:hypothetical protein